MEIIGLHHYLIAAPPDLMERCRAFYEDVIGLVAGDRPSTARRGYWMYAGANPIVHLAIPKPNAPELSGNPPNGYIDHVAIACKGLPSTLEKLKRQKVPYRLSVVPAPAQVQVVVEDPAGTIIELNFRNESLPEGERP